MKIEKNSWTSIIFVTVPIVVIGFILMIAFCCFVGYMVKKYVEPKKSELKEIVENDYREDGEYVILLDSICLADADWTRGIWGGELDIELTVYQNGTPIFVTSMDGQRGERKINSIFMVQHTLMDNYQIKVEEKSTWTERWIIEYPKIPGIKWILNEKIYLNTSFNSWIKFRTAKIE